MAECPAKKTRTTSDTDKEGHVHTKTRRRHVRGRRGGLRDMPQMPLDISFEIFAYMTPVDLLNLSRTSKPFRTLLISRESVPLWKASRKNVPGLPDCPPFLSEPAYANLCFDSHCHHCLKSNVQPICWEVAVRYCSSCEKQFFHEARSMAYFDVVYFNKNLSSPVPYEITGEHVNDFTNPMYRHKPTIEVFKKRWVLLTSDEQREEALLEYRTRKNERVSFARACEIWSIRRKDERKEELRRIKEDREEEVLRRLKKLGYGDDLEYSHGSYRYNPHPLWEIPKIIQPRPWTDRSWKNMEGKILEVMNKIRTERLFEIRTAAIEPRVDLLESVLIPWRRATGVISPHTYDFLLVPEVKSLIDAPPNKDITVSEEREMFKKLEPVFYRFHREWEKEQLAILAKLVSLNLSLPIDADPCALAISQFFTCSKCSKAISFPNVLVHYCQSSRQPSHKEDTYDSVLSHLSRGSGRPTLKSLTLADGLREAIEACGQNPSTVTANEMDVLDIRLECETCQRDGVLNAFTWRRAFQHSQINDVHKYASYYKVKRPAVWRQVPVPYIPVVKDLETNLARNVKQRKDEGFCYMQWFCAHCSRRLDLNSWYCAYSTRHSKRLNVIRHLKDTHGIDDPAENDYFQDPWHDGYDFDSYYVSLMFKTTSPTPQWLETKLTNGEAKIVDPPPDEGDVSSI